MSLINKKLNITFFVQSFPAISEIWITNQIVALLEDGHHVDIYAQFKADDVKIHQKVLDYDLLGKTTYLDSLPKSKFRKLKLFFSKLIQNPSFSNLQLSYYYLVYLLLYKKKKISFYSTIHFLDKPEYDIAHAHYGFNGKYALLLKEIGLLKKSKLVTSFHGFDFNVSAGFYDELFHNGHLFVVNSNYSTSKLLALGCSEKKITKLPVGLQIDYFVKKSQHLLQPEKKFTLLFVGRFVEFKSPHTFIEICKSLSDKNIAFEAKMIGDGELRESVLSLIQKYNLESKVFLFGKQTQEEIKTHFSNSDVFVLTGVVDSHGIAETQGLVIQEAQAMELPVIVSDAGGMREGIIENETGYVIKSNDIEGFVEKIIYLQANEEVRKETGRMGRAFVEENYNIQKLNEKMVAFYHELMSK